MRWRRWICDALRTPITLGPGEVYYVSLEALRKCVMDAVKAADPSFTGGFPELERSWKSRTAMLYRFRIDGLPDGDIVVKHCGNGQVALMEYQAMKDTADALDEHAPQVSAPVRPLAVSERLGALVMPYVSGKALSDVLAEEDWSFRNVNTRIADMMDLCGIVLAAYHKHFQENGRKRRPAAWNHLVERFAMVLGHDHIPERIVAGCVVSKSYIDFHPHHIFLRPSGKLTLLDPPGFERWAFVHRDLARFNDRLMILLLRSKWRTPFALRARFHELLCERFLSSYENAMGWRFTTRDRALVRGFEGFFLQRRLGRLWRKKSIPTLLYYGMPMTRGYLGARRSLAAFLKTFEC